MCIYIYIYTYICIYLYTLIDEEKSWDSRNKESWDRNNNIVSESDKACDVANENMLFPDTL